MYATNAVFVYHWWKLGRMWSNNSFVYLFTPGPEIFNRAALMNVGYLEAHKVGHFDCYVFHDVDLIPEDLTNIYACTERPRHLVATRSVTSYQYVC